MKQGYRVHFMLSLLALLVASSAPALASSAGISQVQAGANTLITFVQYIAGLGAIILIAMSIWEFFAHHKISQAIVEFVSGVIIGLIAYNAQAIATALGFSGSVLK